MKTKRGEEFRRHVLTLANLRDKHAATGDDREFGDWLDDGLENDEVVAIGAGVYLDLAAYLEAMGVDLRDQG